MTESRQPRDILREIEEDSSSGNLDIEPGNDERANRVSTLLRELEEQEMPPADAHRVGNILQFLFYIPGIGQRQQLLALAKRVAQKLLDR